MAEQAVEVWRNTAAGTRWFRAFDVRGAETTKLVQGNRTFTLTTMERQLNQDRVASPEQDLFRNGTFVLSKASEQTILDEVESPNSKTDAEIDEIVRELIHGEGFTLAQALEGIDSLNTVQRIMEGLILEDASVSMVDDIKARMRELDPAMPVERTVVVTGPDGPTKRKPPARKA